MGRLLEDWERWERRQRQKWILLGIFLLVTVTTVTSSFVIRAQEKDTSHVRVENGFIYAPEGYETRYVSVVTVKGETVERTARELIEKFGMEDITDLHTYELAFLHLNKTVKLPYRDFKSGVSYLWPYWVPITD